MEKADKPKEGIQLTIIERIESLMDSRDVKQAALARGTGIAQSHLSRSMSRKGPNNISIDSLMKIADFFKVPVDYLLGREAHEVPSVPKSSAEICRQLINLIETGLVNMVNRDVEEDTYQPNKGDLESWTYPYQYEKKTNNYPMFYFSNFLPLPDMTNMSEYEIEEVEFQLDNEGLYHNKGIEINAFINYYMKLRDLRKNNDLPLEFFNQAVEDRLNQMRF